MSDLSKIKNEFEGFLESMLGYVPPEAQATVQAAGASVSNTIATAASSAAATAEGAGAAVLTAEAPTLETAIASAVPAELKPIASLVVQLGLAEVTSRLQSASTPKA